MKLKRNELRPFTETTLPVIEAYIENVQYIKRLIDFIESDDYAERMEKFKYAYHKNVDKIIVELKHIANKSVEQEPKTEVYLEFKKELDVLAKEKNYLSEENKILNEQLYSNLYSEIIEKHPEAKIDYEKFRKEFTLYMEKEIDIDIHFLDDKNLPVMTTQEMEACKFFIGKPDVKMSIVTDVVDEPVKVKKSKKQKYDIPQAVETLENDINKE